MKRNLYRMAILLGAFAAPFFSNNMKAQRGRIVVKAPAGVSAETLRSEMQTLTVFLSGNQEIESNDKYVQTGKDFSTAPGYVYDNLKTTPVTLSFQENSDGCVWTSPLISLRTLQSQLNLTKSEVSYRLYTPHFVRPLTGRLTFSSAEGIQKLEIGQMENCKRVAFNPIISNGGAVISGTLAPDLKSGIFSPYQYGDVNTVSFKDEPFAVYVAPGEKVRYAIVPSESRYAMHVDSLVVGHTDMTIDTDYRKAVKCHLYINDSKGKRCDIPYATSVSSSFYQRHPLAPAYGYGSYYGRLCNLPRYIDNNTIIIYALPGTQYFQLCEPDVQTDDEDYMTPYNATSHYLVSRVTINEGVGEQDVVMATSRPMKDNIVLHGAAKYNDQLILHYSRTCGDDTDPASYNPTVSSEIIEFKTIKREVVGDDIHIATLVNAAAGDGECSVLFANRNDTICSYMGGAFYDLFSGKTGRNLTEQNFTRMGTPMNFSKIHPVSFVAPCVYFQERNRLFMGLWKDHDFTPYSHRLKCIKPVGKAEEPLPNDTIAFLLPENTYYWFGGKDYNDRLQEVQTLVVGNNTENMVVPIISADDFAFVRLSDMGTVKDSLLFGHEPSMVYNNKVFKRERIDGKMGLNTYWANSIFKLQYGYNEIAVKYHGITVESDSVGCYRWVQKHDEEVGDYCDVTNERPEKLYAKNNGRIFLAENSEADLIIEQDYSPGINSPVYRYHIKNLFADTTIHIGFSQQCTARLYYKEKGLSAYRDVLEGALELTDLTRNAHVLVGLSDLLNQDSICLLPGKYRFRTLGGDDEISFDVVFTIEKACRIDLDRQETSIGEVTTGENISETARYTIDGRCIARPQRGINLVRMSDGSLRKVLVK